jgi:hypothetical protein
MNIFTIDTGTTNTRVPVWHDSLGGAVQCIGFAHANFLLGAVQSTDLPTLKSSSAIQLGSATASHHSLQ